VQGDHLSVKPWNVRFDSSRGNVWEFGKGRNCQGKCVIEINRMSVVYNFIVSCIPALLWMAVFKVLYSLTLELVNIYEQQLTHAAVPQLSAKCRGTLLCFESGHPACIILVTFSLLIFIKIIMNTWTDCVMLVLLVHTAWGRIDDIVTAGGLRGGARCMQPSIAAENTRQHIIMKYIPRVFVKQDNKKCRISVVSEQKFSKLGSC